MAGGLFSRLKTWVKNETVTAAQLNGEFDNVISNLRPIKFDDYSSSVSEMQTTTDPGEVGSESLATTLAGELERIRFAISEMKGTTQWYETASTSLENLNDEVTAAGTTPPNRIASGRVRSATDGFPIVLQADGAGNGQDVTALGATTNLKYFIKNTEYTLSTDITLTFASFPSASDTAAVDDTSLTDQMLSRTQGERNSVLSYDTAAGSFATSGIGAYELAGGATEYFLAFNDGSSELSRCKRGYFFDESDSPITRATAGDNDVLTRLSLHWVFITSTQTLKSTTVEPVVAYVQPTSPSTGDYWLDMSEATHTWKRFDGATWSDDNSTLLGLAVVDDTDCVATRTFEFHKTYTSDFKFPVLNSGNTTIEAMDIGSVISVAGSKYVWPGGVDKPVWDITTDLDDGDKIGTEAATTDYYGYVTENGDLVMSDIMPYDRPDLLGHYHPWHLWRCVWVCVNNGSSNLETPFTVDGDYFEELHIAASNKSVPAAAASANVILNISGGSLLVPGYITTQLVALVRSDILDSVLLQCNVSDANGGDVAGGGGNITSGDLSVPDASDYYESLTFSSGGSEGQFDGRNQRNTSMRKYQSRATDELFINVTVRTNVTVSGNLSSSLLVRRIPHLYE